jgi:hypothetical protein
VVRGAPIDRLNSELPEKPDHSVGRETPGGPDGARVHVKGKLKPLGGPHWFAIRYHTYDCRVYEMRDPCTRTRLYKYSFRNNICPTEYCHLLYVATLARLPSLLVLWFTVQDHTCMCPSGRCA